MGAAYTSSCWQDESGKVSRSLPAVFAAGNARGVI
jgi:hypothetical protein